MNKQQLVIGVALLTLGGAIRYLEPIRQQAVDMNACVHYRTYVNPKYKDHDPKHSLNYAVNFCNGK